MLCSSYVELTMNDFSLLFLRGYLHFLFFSFLILSSISHFSVIAMWGNRQWYSFRSRYVTVRSRTDKRQYTAKTKYGFNRWVSYDFRNARFIQKISFFLNIVPQPITVSPYLFLQVLVFMSQFRHHFRKNIKHYLSYNLPIIWHQIWRGLRTHQIPRWMWVPFCRLW